MWLRSPDCTVSALSQFFRARSLGWQRQARSGLQTTELEEAQKRTSGKWSCIEQDREQSLEINLKGPGRGEKRPRQLQGQGRWEHSKLGLGLFAQTRPPSTCPALHPAHGRLRGPLHFSL